MAEVEYLHICDSAFAAEGGKHCIIGIFDVIHATSFPAVHPIMAIAMRVLGQAHEPIAIKLELGRPTGEALLTMPMDITVGPDGGANINVNLVNTQFPEAGRYVIKVSSAGRTLVSHSLHLHKMHTPPQAAPQGGPPARLH